MSVSVSAASDETEIVSPASVGRPKKSAVWDYFCYDSLHNKSVCQVKGTSESLCNKSIAGKNPTNLKQHLRSSILL